MSFPRNIYMCRVAPTVIRHASTIVEGGEVWTEIFDDECWIADSKTAPLMLRHDDAATVVGSLVSRVVHGGWHLMDFMLDPDRPLASVAYDRLRVGTPVSLGARSLRRDDNPLSGVRRHVVARLEHVAIVEPAKFRALPARRSRGSSRRRRSRRK